MWTEAKSEMKWKDKHFWSNMRKFQTCVQIVAVYLIIYANTIFTLFQYLKF